MTSSSASTRHLTVSPALRSAPASVLFACLAMAVSYLPFSASNGALGLIAQSTGADTAQLQWVPDAFAIALGATVLSAGVLGDILGRRRVVVWGLSLTAVGSGVAFLAGFESSNGILVLCAGQALSGIGGGLVMSASLALIAAVSPSPSFLARAISFWAAAVVVGLGSGPFLAGWVQAALPWQWMYLPIVVLAISVVVYGALLAAESTAPGRRFDLPGQVTSALGIAALTFGAISGGTAGWSAPPTIVALTLGVVALLAFIRIENRTASPLMNPSLFRSGGFTAAGIAATSVLFSISGGVFVISLHLSSVHVDGLGIALRLGTLFAGNAVASVLAGFLQRFVQARHLLLSGLVLAAAGAFSVISVDGSTDIGGYAWRLATFGFGGGLVMATSSAIAVQSVPSELAGMAGAANNAMRQFGSALGPAVLGGVLSLQLAGGGSSLTALRISGEVLGVVLLLAALISIGLRWRPIAR